MPETRPLRPHDPEGVGGYRLTGLIGEGAQGTVYLGESESGRRVAVKILRADFGRDPRARTGFERELAAARRVAPFCTAPILAADAGTVPPYIVSEYIEGPSLRDLVFDRGVMTGAQLTGLAIGTATALAAIHEAGVVHRDFKPANVLLSAGGPRVIDFGIARALDSTSTTMTGAVGTPAYMAPEQVAGSSGGAPLDMFAWGCTIAFAANGRPPFGTDTVPAIMRRVLYEEPDLGALTGDLRDLVASCLAKDPAHRPTALQVLQRLLGADNESDLLTRGSSVATHTSSGSAPASPDETPGDAPSDAPGEALGEALAAPPSPPPAPPPPVAPPGGAWTPATFPPPAPSAAPRPHPAPGRRPGDRRLLISAAGVAATALVAAGITGAVLLRDGGPPGGGPTGGGRTAAATTPSAGDARQGCRYGPATGPARDVGTPPPQPPSLPSGATIETSLGTLEVRLDPAKAPCAVNSLAFLAGKNFFDGTRCHRLTSNTSLKILQCGDPTGTGTGGPGYTFASENTAGVRYARGTVAMANAGPDTNGSQFFIVYEDAPRLPPVYPVIGRVTSGMEVVDRVARAGTATGGDDGVPKQEITIADVRTS
ncbi:MAG TPA: peptidylprolyl isomerase [Spirillospora sp.]